MPRLELVMTDNITLRPCPPEQHTLLRSWIQQLANYEGKPEAVTITHQRLQELLREGAFDASFILHGSTTIGYTVTFPQTSTYSGATSLYLEDIFIAPEHRGRGMGTKVMQLLAAKARSIGATTMSWSVLRTNRAAMNFYEKLGATPIVAWGHYAIDLKHL